MTSETNNDYLERAEESRTAYATIRESKILFFSQILGNDALENIEIPGRINSRRGRVRLIKTTPCIVVIRSVMLFVSLTIFSFVVVFWSNDKDFV